jgi:hypothetical protein
MKALERAHQIASRLGEVDAARQYTHEAQALQNKLELLRELRVTLRARVETAAVLVDGKVLDSAKLPNVGQMRDSLAKLAEAFAGDTRTLTSGRLFTTLTRHLESATQVISEATAAAWKDVTSAAPKTNEKLLGRIEQIPSLADSVRKLREAVSEFTSAIRTPPASQVAWNRYAELRARVADLVGGLNTDRFPEPVLEFWKLAQSRDGAPLDLLTPEVQQWLKENQMYDDLRLRLL